MEKLINDFSFGLFFWQMVSFVLLLLLLKKVVWKHILEALKSREEGIQNALDEADKARQKMVNLKSSNEKILKEARLERDGLLKDARKHASSFAQGGEGEGEVRGGGSLHRTAPDPEQDRDDGDGEVVPR